MRFAAVSPVYWCIKLTAIRELTTISQVARSIIGPMRPIGPIVIIGRRLFRFTLLLDLLDQAQSVVTGDEREVFVAADIF